MGVYHSEKSLENFLNAGGLPSPLIIDAKGGVYNVNGAPGEAFGRSAKAQAVIDRMTGLTPAEENIITTLVDSQDTAGNYDLWKEFFAFSLSGNNSLIGFVSKTATAVNSPAQGINGYSFTGTESIDSNWNPTTDGASLNNMGVGSFVKSNTPNNNTIPFDTSMLLAFIRQQPLSSRLQFGVNGGNKSFGGESQLSNDSLYLVNRIASNSTKLIKNGSVLDTSTQASTALSINNLIFGSGYTGTLAIGIAYEPVGFDHASFNTDIIAFLTALGTLP